MKREIISPLLADTIRHRKIMVVHIARDIESYPENRSTWHNITTVFQRDPMKPGKWYYQREYDRTEKKLVYLPDKLFAIDRNWFNTYFTKTYCIKFSKSQRSGFRRLNSLDVNVADAFKKRFKEADIVNYLFILDQDPFGIQVDGIGFLDETDAILGQQFLDGFTWNDDDQEFTLP